MNMEAGSALRPGGSGRPGALGRLLGASRQHVLDRYGQGDWTSLPRDLREPDPDPSDNGAGPWRVPDGASATRPAHGIYTREASGISWLPADVPALTEWVAAGDGWPMFRWAGPQMEWAHPLVSAWNPILAQYLCFAHAERHCPWPDHEEWVAEALLGGHKPAGYFGGLPRAEMDRWVRQARAGGLTVEYRRGGALRGRGSAFAAATGTLEEVYGRGALVTLASEYRYVLTLHGMPQQRAEDLAAEIYAHRATEVSDLLTDLDETPRIITGLTLGYPPEVTAGVLLHHHFHGGAADCRFLRAECGALCGREADQ